MAALTFAGYVVAWFYEMGYAVYFAIPLDLVRIEVSSIAIACMCVAALGAVLALVVWGSSRLMSTGHRVLAWIGRGVIILAPPIVVCSISGWTWVRFLGGLAIMAAAVPAIGVAKKRLALVPRRLLVVIFVYAAVFSAVGAFTIGAGVATQRSSFPVETVGGRDYAVLSVYGDTVVAALFDHKTRKVQPTFVVQKIDGKPRIFRREEIGPLVVGYHPPWWVLLFRSP